MIFQANLDHGSPKRKLVWKPFSSPYRAGKRVIQMEAVRDREVIFVLTEEGVNMYSIPNLKLKCQAPRTAGAFCFCWDPNRSLLIVASKKRLAFFKYKLDLVLERDIMHGLSSSPKFISKTGDSVFLASQYEVLSITVPNGVITKVQISGSFSETNNSKGAVYDNPHITSLHSTEFGALITSGNITRCFDPRGKRKKLVIEWSDSPTQIILLGEYHRFLAAVLPTNTIQLQSLSALTDRLEDKDLFQQNIAGDWGTIDLIATSSLSTSMESTGQKKKYHGVVQNSNRTASRKSTGDSVLKFVEDVLRSALFIVENNNLCMFYPASPRHLAAQLLELGQFEAVLSLSREIALEELDEEGERDEDEEEVEAKFSEEEKTSNYPQRVSTLPLLQSDLNEIQKIKCKAHLGVGKQLLLQQSYDEAMHHLSLGDVYNPLPLICYFPPDFLAPDWMIQMAHSATSNFDLPSEKDRHLINDLDAAVTATVPYLLACRARLAMKENVKNGIGNYNKESIFSNSTVKNTSKEIRSYSSGDIFMQTNSRRDKFCKVLPPKSKSKTDILLHSRSIGTKPNASTSNNTPSSFKIPRSPASIVLDTALAKALLRAPDRGDLLQLVQRPNSIDLETATKAFEQEGRFAEMIALYESSNPSKALEFLRYLALDRDKLPSQPQGAALNLTGQPAAWAAIRILSRIDPLDMKILKENSEWILGIDQEAGIGLFARLFPKLTPSVAIPMLNKCGGPQMCAQYLEYVLDEGSGHEQELASMYLQQLLAIKESSDMKYFETDISSSNKAKDVSKELELKKKLKELVRRIFKIGKIKAFSEMLFLCIFICIFSFSNINQLFLQILKAVDIDAKAILGMLPSHGYSEIRAALYERQERHIDALRCLIHRLHSIKEAEEYCLRYSKKIKVLDDEQKSKLDSARFNEQRTLLRTVDSTIVWNQLLDILMEEEGSRPGVYHRRVWKPNDSRWVQISDLLGRRREYFDPVEAAKRFPDEVYLASVSNFLQGALQGAVEARRHAVLEKSILRSRSVLYAIEAAEVKRKYVVLTAERACAKCHKRIGNAAFVRLSSSMLLHFSCWKRKRSVISTTK